ncbi:beta-lactamase/transpeptidase-like protein [Apiospora kogelbergensis]|uniref:Beta-lactamase/transpeptidase-like protein n=1 Tax=Apiospora kogelbergensis TaxID=1337665 RepID=A0AAW0Q685_9PEZI
MSSPTLAQNNDIPYSACPLIGSYYPPPTFSRSSAMFAKLSSDFTTTFNQLIEKGGSDKYGPITPSTTSFSVVMFTGTDSRKEDPVFFEYHYTSPRDLSDTGTNITSDTKFPVGDLTMIFTVYAWLVEMGETWDAPITQYLPELGNASNPNGVSWSEVTIGSLAGHMSGLIRQVFAEKLAADPFVFHPDTTPMVSYTAFQLLAFAMQRHKGADTYSAVLHEAVLGPLNMTTSGLLNSDMKDIFAPRSLNLTQHGEPGAISLVSTTIDLSRAGHAILSSRLLPPFVTRRWLRHSVDTSNLRNGVGRPWEIYRAGRSAIAPVVDVWTKSGSLGAHYASYFGLAPDFDVGFAILAHDGANGGSALDLNVYADIVSEALGGLQGIAAAETAARYAGTYRGGNDSVAVLHVTEDGPGIAVQELRVDGVDVRAQAARQLGIATVADLDFRLYPAIVGENSLRHEFVAVFQDRSAPVDMGTPTCITWQHIGSTAGVEYRYAFSLTDGEVALKFEAATGSFRLHKLI